MHQQIGVELIETLYRENCAVSYIGQELSSRVERYRVLHSDSQLFAEKYISTKKEGKTS